MVAQKWWFAANVCLVILAMILVLTFFGVNVPTLGKAQYLLDAERPLCAVKWKSNYNYWMDIDSCCLESRKQLECQREVRDLQFGRVDWWCHTGSGDAVSYALNNKAYNYCRQLSIW